MAELYAKPNAIEELRQRVVEAVEFIAPYFMMPTHDSFTDFGLPSKLDKLRVVVGKPRYWSTDPLGRKGIMFLPEHATNSEIGHEVGHFLHQWINFEEFANATAIYHHRPPYLCYIETVADYAEAVYMTEGEAVRDFILKPHLKFLARLPRAKAKNLKIEELCLAHRAVHKFI